MRKYLSSLRLAIDFAGVEPNPARDRRLRVPKPVKAERDPPSAANVLAILERVPERLRHFSRHDRADRPTRQRVDDHLG